LEKATVGEKTEERWNQNTSRTQPFIMENEWKRAEGDWGKGSNGTNSIIRTWIKPAGRGNSTPPPKRNVSR